MGVAIICLGQLYTIIDSISYPCYGYSDEVVFDQLFSGNLSSVNPVDQLVIGDATGVTLENLETQGNPVLVSIINLEDATLLNLTCSNHLDLSNYSISLATDYSFYYGNNLTLTLARVANDTLFSVHVFATFRYYSTCGIRIPYYFPAWIIGLILIGLGFKELDQLGKDFLV